jgi:hypothetical protein
MSAFEDAIASDIAAHRGWGAIEDRVEGDCTGAAELPHENSIVEGRELAVQAPGDKKERAVANL